MLSEENKANVADPVVPDWLDVELPDSWADAVNILSWQGLNILWHEVLLGKHRSVELPVDLPGNEIIPKYAQLAFHNIPNGVYSRRFSRGYITGFEYSMLGDLSKARKWMAEEFKGCNSLLDVGCAGGKTASALASFGAKDIWGIDISPYLLKHAQSDHPDISFTQAQAEDLPFRNERFDGIGVCFLFHELPPKYLKHVLAEISRVLKPGGRLIIIEPSPVQLHNGWWHMLVQYFFKGIYFKGLAHFVYEPFLKVWHDFKIESAFEEVGLFLELDEKAMPLRRIIAIKR